MHSPPKLKSQNHLASGGFTGEVGQRREEGKVAPVWKKRERGKKKGWGERKKYRKKRAGRGRERERDDWVHFDEPGVSGSAQHTEIGGNGRGFLTQ